MATRVNHVHWIITAITIQIQAVDGFGVQVGGIIGRDEPTPLGAVIPGVAVIQAGIVIVVIATITNGVGLCLYFTTVPAGSQEKATQISIWVAMKQIGNKPLHV